MQTRQFIPYQVNVAIAPASSPAISIPKLCKRCSSPVRVGHGTLCDVCWSMLEAVATPYFVRLHKQWQAENIRLVANKARMLNPNYGDCDAAQA